MKKIKRCMCAIMFAMAVWILAACSMESDKNQTTSPAGTTQSTTSAGTGETGTNGTSGTSGTGTGSRETTDRYDRDEEESSTGVLNGMADDLEEGVDDVLNGPGVTSASDETR